MISDSFAWLVLVGLAVLLFHLVYRRRHRADPSRRSGSSVSPPVAGKSVAAVLQGSFASNRWRPEPMSVRWFSASEDVVIGRTRIAGGMLYVGQVSRGQGLGAGSGRLESCVVDPSLPIGTRADGPSGLHYWPSYSDLTPDGRRAFINWLVGGRNDPTVDIGFVFIFFYGVERRLFVDRALIEAPTLLAEVERLLGLHGANSSFQRYARTFLDAARLFCGVLPFPDPQPGDGSLEFPLALRVHIGRLLAASRPLDASSALAWVLAGAETRLRTPGRRCFEELKRLWSVRFAARHPAGLAIRAPKRRLTLTYRAASGAFEADIFGQDESLPDIAAITAPLQGLRDLLESCTTELETYSRLLGRRPEARETLEAALLLPAPIRGADHPAIAGVRAKINEIIGPDGMATINLPELTGLLGFGDAPVMTPQLSTRLALMLDNLDIGMEPDRRYGSSPSAALTKVVLFRAAGGGPVAAGRDMFDAARTILEVGVVAALADGSVTQSEQEALLRQARGAQGLEAHERLRLEALVRSLVAEPPRMRAALRRAGALPPEGRSAIAAVAIEAITADGNVQGDEVRFLERLHRTLQLPLEPLHTALHQRAAARDEPVVVAPEDIAAYIPLPPETSSKHPRVITLDAGRLERIRAETSRVSALLADVFAESESTPVPRIPPAEPVNLVSPILGLEAAHGALLAAVLHNGGRMTLEEFDTVARTHALLPRAAIETINDWGFDTFDEPVLEEDDDFADVPAHLRSTLAARLKERQ